MRWVRVWGVLEGAVGLGRAWAAKSRRETAGSSSRHPQRTSLATRPSVSRLPLHPHPIPLSPELQVHPLCGRPHLPRRASPSRAAGRTLCLSRVPSPHPPSGENLLVLSCCPLVLRSSKHLPPETLEFSGEKSGVFRVILEFSGNFLEFSGVHFVSSCASLLQVVSFLPVCSKFSSIFLRGRM